MGNVLSHSVWLQWAGIPPYPAVSLTKQIAQKRFPQDVNQISFIPPTRPTTAISFITTNINFEIAVQHLPKASAAKSLSVHWCACVFASSSLLAGGLITACFDLVSVFCYNFIRCCFKPCFCYCYEDAHVMCNWILGFFENLGLP